MDTNFRTLHAALLLLLDEQPQTRCRRRTPGGRLILTLAALREQGVNTNDLRWLLESGYVRTIAPHTVTNGSPPTSNGRITPSSAFVLTSAGFAMAREIAASEGTAAPEPDRDRDGPVWNAERREFCFNGELVKRFRQPAPAQEMILAAFEEEGWPAHIDDPLPPQDESVPSERLRITIRNLNRRQVHALIRFESDGRGEGVCWRPRSEANERGSETL